VWCSRVCRDGVDHQPGMCRGCGIALTGRRKGAIYCGRVCRMRTVREEVHNSEIIVNIPIQNTGVTDAILASGYGDSLESLSCV
jgi:flavoprotein